MTLALHGEYRGYCVPTFLNANSPLVGAFGFSTLSIIHMAEPPIVIFRQWRFACPMRVSSKAMTAYAICRSISESG